VFVNVTGCLVIGALLAVLLARFPTSPWMRPFFAVGVLGGYTTYSTFAVDAVQLARAGHGGLAVGYVLVSVVGGVLAVVVGLLAGRAVVRAVETVDAELRAGEGLT
jgi:CrcB protein